MIEKKIINMKPRSAQVWISPSDPLRPQQQGHTRPGTGTHTAVVKLDKPALWFLTQTCRIEVDRRGHNSLVIFVLFVCLFVCSSKDLEKTPAT